MILKNNLSLTLSIVILAFAVNANADNRIPVENFFCDSAMTSGTLSPNGKYFAAMVPASGPKCAIESEDEPQSPSVLLVIDLETNKPNVLSGTSGGARVIGFTWLNDSRIAFYRQPQAGLDAYSRIAILPFTWN